MKIYIFIICILATFFVACKPSSAQEAQVSSLQPEFVSDSLNSDSGFTPSLIDYSSFSRLVSEVNGIREGKLIDIDTFLAYSKEENTIILDTRSEAMYKAKHLKGAVHLNFSDFSSAKLMKLIPDASTRILIYCNNNFIGDEIYLENKSQPLALNIPTYINLIGYGYSNIYELSSLLEVANNKLVFEGTTVKI